jgi:hypothetical protein
MRWPWREGHQRCQLIGWLHLQVQDTPPKPHRLLCCSAPEVVLHSQANFLRGEPLLISPNPHTEAAFSYFNFWLEIRD